MFNGNSVSHGIAALTSSQNVGSATTSPLFGIVSVAVTSATMYNISVKISNASTVTAVHVHNGAVGVDGGVVSG